MGLSISLNRIVPDSKGRTVMRFKYLLILVLMVAFMPVTAYGMASFDYPVVNPILSVVDGDVTIKWSGMSQWDAAEAGMLLNSGDSVKTGPGSKAEISCATGKMRLYENTVIIIPEVVDEGDKKDIRKVKLEDGAGIFKIKKRGVEKGFEVHTKHIIAGVKGTLFAVVTSIDDDFSRVAVYSGVVEVTDTAGTPETATELGKATSIDAQPGGLSDVQDFEPASDFKGWAVNPQTPASLLTPVAPVTEVAPAVPPAPVAPAAPAQTSVTQGYDNNTDSEGGEPGSASCPDVTDNNGNTVQ